MTRSSRAVLAVLAVSGLTLGGLVAPALAQTPPTPKPAVHGGAASPTSGSQKTSKRRKSSGKRHKRGPATPQAPTQH